MRKITILFIVLLLPVMTLMASLDRTETSFDIVAYRVGQREEKGPYFYVVDALNNSLENVSSTGESEEIDSYSRDMTGYLSDYLASSLDKDNGSNVLFSFRVEGNTTGTYYVTTAVSDFFPVDSNNENAAPISGSYAFDNFDVRFNRSGSQSSIPADGYGYDGNIKETLETNTGTITPVATNKGYYNAIQSSDSFASAWWTIKDNPTGDYWICRGAVRLQIDESEYVLAPNGTYRTTVVIEWGTIS